MKLLKGTHLTTDYNPALVAELGAARVLGTAPFHYQFQRGNYSGVDALGIPIVRHVYDSRAVISTEAAQNLQTMPNGAEWLMHNEPDLPIDEGNSHWDAQTPAEAADYLIRNMEAVTPVADANAKYILAAGSQDAMPNWFEQYVTEIRARRPDVLARFCAVGVHYYWYSSHTIGDAIQFFSDAYKAMKRAGLGELGMWVTEFGVGAGNHTIAETCEYITAFFNEAALKQAKGRWLWLKLVAWFVFNEGEQWGTYHALSNANGKLSRIGRRFRDA